jgi:uncharacterized RDD family membrane protein YckC
VECPKCGIQNSANSSTCTCCGAELEHTIAADETHADGPVLVAGYGLASLWRRFGALILDMIALTALGSLILIWAANRWKGADAASLHLTGAPLLATTVGTALLGILYFWIMEAIFGATLGKAFLGIQVRRVTGEGPGFRAAFIRTLARLLDVLPAFYLLGWLFAVLSMKRQRIGDRMAGTVVILRDSFFFTLVGAVFYLATLGAMGWQFYRLYRNMHPISLHIVTGTGGNIDSGAHGAQSGSATLPPTQSGNLKMQNFTFTEGNSIAPRSTSVYQAGDDVYARYELTGYGSNPQGNIAVAIRVTSTDPNGLALDRPWENTVSGESKGAGTPIQVTYRIHLPPFAPAGIYKLNIHAQDNVANSAGDFAPAFTVENPSPVLAAMKLDARDFHFARSKEGEPISPAEYHAGESVYYSFRLLGMQFREDHLNLHIAYKLLGPDGNVLLSKPDWESLNDSYVYHPANFFLLVTGYLDLPADSKPGTYTLQYEIADNNGSGSTTYESKFEVK